MSMAERRGYQSTRPLAMALAPDQHKGKKFRSWPPYDRDTRSRRALIVQCAANR